MATGSNLFLKMSGVTGECQEEGHKGEIEVQHYSEGAHNTASGGTGMGGGVGISEFQDFRFGCKLEKAVPTLLKFCADHKPIAEAKFSAAKMGGSGASYTYLEITLTNARVSNVDVSGGANELGSAQVVLNFEKIKIEYWEENSTGGKGGSSPITWDVKANKLV